MYSITQHLNHHVRNMTNKNIRIILKG